MAVSDVPCCRESRVMKCHQRPLWQLLARVSQADSLLLRMHQTCGAWDALLLPLQPLPGEHYLCHSPVPPHHGATSMALVWGRWQEGGAAVLTGSCAFVPLRWA